MPRWYGLMWALGFYLGFIILKRMYKSEGVPNDWLDKSFTYVFIGGILGARLGHCLFYQPDYYLAHPLEILKIWEGGLASHGGAVGIIIATFILSKKHLKTDILWPLDHFVVPTAFAGGLIRLGNLFNHEILGKITDSPIGFKFLRDDGPTVSNPLLSVRSLLFKVTNTTNITESNYNEKLEAAYNEVSSHPDKYSYFISEIPSRYPAQLIEAICYFIIFGIMMWLYWKTNAGKLKGFLLGTFFVLVFGARFLIEFIKENQEGIDQNLTGLNMGQYLSIPLVLIGLFFVFKNIKSLNFNKKAA